MEQTWFKTQKQQRHGHGEDVPSCKMEGADQMKTLYCHLLSLLSQDEIELKRIRRVRSGSQGHANRMSIQIPLQHCGCEMELSGLKIDSQTCVRQITYRVPVCLLLTDDSLFVCYI